MIGTGSSAIQAVPIIAEQATEWKADLTQRLTAAHVQLTWSVEVDRDGHPQPTVPFVDLTTVEVAPSPAAISSRMTDSAR